MSVVNFLAKLNTFLLFIIGLSLFFPKNIYAVTITIDSYPSDVNESAFTINFSVSGAATADNYFRVDLYKDTTSSYFGETYNGSDWYNGSDGKQYFKYSMISGSTANISLQARLGNPTSSEFTGPGTYKLKIRRYTASGAASTTDDQIPVDVNITYVTPTPSPTPTPIPTFSPTPTFTPTPTISSTPTSSPTPTLTPTQTPTPTPKLTAAASPIISPKETGIVLGDTQEPNKEPLTYSEIFGKSDEIKSDNSENNKKFPILPVILTLSGISFIGFTTIPAFKRYIFGEKNEYNSDSDDTSKKDEETI